MMKPLIGLTATRYHNSTGDPTYTINEAYAKSVAAAGGLPVLLPLDLPEQELASLLSRLDGILFTGGDDIDPQRYQGQQHGRVGGIDSNRDQTELCLLHQAVEQGKPFFGICRGLQVINVALGGSLYEHLPAQFEVDVHHDNHDKPRDHLAHPVSVESQTQLAGIIGSPETRVNSLHHQGIHRLAPDLNPVAHSTDGLVEAFELPGQPFGMAVQWHPEELQAHESMRRLFEAFVQACSELHNTL